MKTHESENGIIPFFLPIICIYFLCFFCFSSIQTLFPCRLLERADCERLETISSISRQISLEMPIEKREEWLDSLSRNPGLIFVSARKVASHQGEERENYLSISSSVPLSILLL